MSLEYNSVAPALSNDRYAASHIPTLVIVFTKVLAWERLQALSPEWMSVVNSTEWALKPACTVFHWYI